MSDDLVRWLRAQLDEDERVITKSLAHLGGPPDPFDYDRLSAEVEAKRKLIDWLDGELADDAEAVMPRDALCWLAEPYADRPGWLPEWAIIP